METDMQRLTTCVLRATLLALSLLTALLAQPQATPSAQRPSPKQALEQARALAAQAKGKSGAERAAALEAGAKAYQNVAATHAADPGVVAEAAFEAAELWRRKGALADAEANYRAALDADRGRYGPRASFELAHLLRRGKKFDAAVELYREVAAMQPGSARAHSALLWVGRTLQAATRLDDAIVAFETALQAAPTPASLITTANWLAKVKIKQGDHEGARATIADVDRRVAADVAGDTPGAKRLQTALAEMSARRSLQRSLDKKNNAAADALDAEDNDGDGDGDGEREETGDSKKPADHKPEPKTPVGKRNR
jgi:tetratricopeptide (TPR) repeat protein